MTDAVTGAPMTLHLTFLAPDGSGKADRRQAPAATCKAATSAGGVVRLWPDEAVTYGLCVAEGIETALTAARGFGLAWACLDAGNLAGLPVLPGVEALTIVADHDEAGTRAADACAPTLARGRARGAGVEGAGRGRRPQRLRQGGRGMKTAEDIRREFDGGANITVLKPKSREPPPSFTDYVISAVELEAAHFDPPSTWCGTSCPSASPSSAPRRRSARRGWT